MMWKRWSAVDRGSIRAVVFSDTVVTPVYIITWLKDHLHPPGGLHLQCKLCYMLYPRRGLQTVPTSAERLRVGQMRQSRQDQSAGCHVRGAASPTHLWELSGTELPATLL